MQIVRRVPLSGRLGMPLSLIVEELSEAPHPPVRRGRRSFFRLHCENCAAPVRSRTTLCPRCGAPQPVRSLARVGAIVGPFMGLGAVVAVFVLCAHLLAEPVPEGPPAPHDQPSSPQLAETDPSDISLGAGHSVSTAAALPNTTNPGAKTARE
jgi:hypothetical protein